MIFKSQIILLLVYCIIKIGYTLIFVYPTNALSINTLDVGQGDAILIRTSSNSTVLIDGGPSYDVESYLGGSSLLNYCKIDVMLLSHDHQDHSYGLNRIKEHCMVGKYIDNMHAGDVFMVDDVHFYVLWPPVDFEDTSNENNNSMVILLDYGDFEAIFTGDAEASVYSKITIPNGILDGSIDLYKVPHHGAINGLNKDFIKSHPVSMAVISVGAKNKFKHPSPDVLKFYESLGVKIYRTDLEGSLEIRLPKL